MIGLEEPPTPFDLMDRKSFGLRLRELRMRAKLTQLALAEKLETTSANVSRWESDKMDFPSHRIPDLAKALDVSVSTLFRDPSPDVPETPMGRPRASPPDEPPAKRKR